MKIVLKAKILVGCIIFFLVADIVSAQLNYKRLPVSVSRPEMEKMRDSLRVSFGPKKKIDEKYELAYLAAVRYYPELAGMRIRIREKKLKSTMAARPAVFSFLRTKKKRKYLILVNKNAEHPSPTFSEFTFNAQVGVFGHELAHILSYTKKGFLPIVGDGIRYRKQWFKTKMENETDSTTIVRGLGWQLYDFSSQLLQNDSVSEAYKLYKRNTYFTPARIFDLMGDIGYDI